LSIAKGEGGVKEARGPDTMASAVVCCAPQTSIAHTVALGSAPPAPWEMQVSWGADLHFQKHASRHRLSRGNRRAKACAVLSPARPAAAVHAPMLLIFAILVASRSCRACGAAGKASVGSLRRGSSGKQGCAVGVYPGGNSAGQANSKTSCDGTGGVGQGRG
jgi:hypothetical protein